MKIKKVLVLLMTCILTAGTLGSTVYASTEDQIAAAQAQKQEAQAGLAQAQANISSLKVGGAEKNGISYYIRYREAGTEAWTSGDTNAVTGTSVSASALIRDETGRAVGIFALNYDITLLRAMGDTIAEVVGTEPSAPREPEPIVRSVADLLDDLIEQSVELVGTPVALMTKEEKVRAIRYLNDTGAFLITKSGPKVCKFFGISKYTLYSYLDEAKNGPKE